MAAAVQPMSQEAASAVTPCGAKSHAAPQMPPAYTTVVHMRVRSFPRRRSTVHAQLAPAIGIYTNRKQHKRGCGVLPVARSESEEYPAGAQG